MSIRLDTTRPTYVARPAAPVISRVQYGIVTALVFITLAVVLLISHRETCAPIDVSDPAVVSDERIDQYRADGYTGRVNDGGEFLYASGC